MPRSHTTRSTLRPPPQRGCKLSTIHLQQQTTLNQLTQPIPGAAPRSPSSIKMQTSGFTNTPLAKALLIYTIASSIALSIFDSKHLAAIHVTPHLFPYGQFWRCLTWQIAGFTNSTEALFAALMVYHVRVVERGWGSRKVAVCAVPLLSLYSGNAMLTRVVL